MHVAVVGAFLLYSVVRGLFREKPLEVIPMEFVTLPAPPAQAEAAVSPPSPAPAPPSAPPDEITPVKPKPPKADPEPPPKPVRRKVPVKVNEEVVERQVGKPAPKPPAVRPDDIKKLFDFDGKPSPSVPSSSAEDQRCLMIIQRYLHDAWRQRNLLGAPDVVPQVRIRFGGGGAVLGGELVKSSGNAAMDQAVLECVRSVGRIPGLSSEFLARHQALTVDFILE